MKHVLRCWGIVILLGTCCLPALRAQADGEPQALFQKVLGSALQNDFPGLMSVCDQGMRDKVTPEMLTDLSRSWVTRFRLGYSATYMGYLDKQGAKVYYWRLVMKDRGDDVLMTLVIRQGVVSAFNLK